MTWRESTLLVLTGFALIGCSGGVAETDGLAPLPEPLVDSPTTSAEAYPAGSSAIDQGADLTLGMFCSEGPRVGKCPVVVGDWLVGHPYAGDPTLVGVDPALIGVNWKSGNTWTSRPQEGGPTAKDPTDAPGIVSADGRVVIHYVSQTGGDGIKANRYAQEVATIDPSTGTVVNRCTAPAQEVGPDSGGYGLPFAYLDAFETGPLESSAPGPLLAVDDDNRAARRFDATTCSFTWASEVEAISDGDGALSNGTVLFSAGRAINAADGSVMWNWQTLNGVSIQEFLGTHGDSVATVSNGQEGESVQNRNVATGAPTGAGIPAQGSQGFDVSTGITVTRVGDTLTGYSATGTQSWQVADVDRELEIIGACQGRAWVRDHGTDQTHMINISRGTVDGPNSPAPWRCLSATRAIYGPGDDSVPVGTIVVRDMPPLR